MKYTSKISRKDGGISWVFKPPRDAASAGIVKTQTFRDGRTARSEVSKLLDKIDAFRKGELVTGDLGKLSTLSQVVGHYLNTKHFNSLSPNTQKNYQFNLKSITRTEVYGKQLSNFCVDSVSVPVCTEMYDIWEQDVSTNSANEYARVFSMLMNYCVSLKDSDFDKVIDANRRFSKERPDVPLHLGVTEAGLPPEGIIKTRIALEQLISAGIGDTVRVSLTLPNEQKGEEIKVGREILSDIEAGRFRSVPENFLEGLNIIACPSCSRVENDKFVDLAEEVRQITKYAESHKVTIAVMGCRVNGPGETDDADLGLWCGPSRVNLKKGTETLGSYSYEKILEHLKTQLDLIIASRVDQKSAMS